MAVRPVVRGNHSLTRRFLASAETGYLTSISDVNLSITIKGLNPPNFP